MKDKERQSVFVSPDGKAVNFLTEFKLFWKHDEISDEEKAGFVEKFRNKSYELLEIEQPQIDILTGGLTQQKQGEPILKPLNAYIANLQKWLNSEVPELCNDKLVDCYFMDPDDMHNMNRTKKNYQMYSN